MPSRPSKFKSLPFNPWPAVLPETKRTPVLPLALGLHVQLQARLPVELHGKLSQKLCRYRYSLRYQQALAKAGSQRHDIDGRPVEPVSEEHREGARAFVAHMQAAMQAAKQRAATRRREREAAAPPPKPPKRPVLTLKTTGAPR